MKPYDYFLEFDQKVRELNRKKNKLSYIESARSAERLIEICKIISTKKYTEQLQLHFSDAFESDVILKKVRFESLTEPLANHVFLIKVIVRHYSDDDIAKLKAVNTTISFTIKNLIESIQADLRGMDRPCFKMILSLIKKYYKQSSLLQEE